MSHSLSKDQDFWECGNDGSPAAAPKFGQETLDQQGVFGPPLPFDAAGDVDAGRSGDTDRFGDVVRGQSAGQRPRSRRHRPGPLSDRGPIQPATGTAVLRSTVSVQQGVHLRCNDRFDRIADLTDRKRAGRQLDCPDDPKALPAKAGGGLGRFVAVKLHGVQPDRFGDPGDPGRRIVDENADAEQPRFARLTRQSPCLDRRGIQKPHARRVKIQADRVDPGRTGRPQIRLEPNATDFYGKQIADPHKPHNSTGPTAPEYPMIDLMTWRQTFLTVLGVQ